MVDYYIKDKNGIDHMVEHHKTRVILTTSKYGKSSSDPVWGTGWACVGTVVGISKDKDDPIRVDWDNNRTNIYNPDHLQVHLGKEVKDNPNFTFKRAKKTANPCHDEKAVKTEYEKAMEEVDEEPVKESATPNLDRKINEVKDKYKKAMKAVGDTESESVMTKGERKQALDLINSTKNAKKEEDAMDKNVNYFNNYMSKPSTSTDDEDEMYDDDYP